MSLLLTLNTFYTRVSFVEFKQVNVCWVSCLIPVKKCCCLSVLISDIVLVSIDFPLNSVGDGLFHRTAYDNCCADWDGFRDNLRDVT